MIEPVFIDLGFGDFEGNARRKHRATSNTPGIVRVLLSCLAISAMGCAPGTIAIVTDATGHELSEAEGLLVVQIDTDVPLQELVAGPFVIASNLPKGQHLWVVRVPAGEYEWRHVDLGSESGRSAHLATRDVTFPDWMIDSSDEFQFDVQPGLLNYPGAVVIRTSPFGRSSAQGIEFRIRNHAAMAVRQLQKRQPTLLEAFSIRYAGVRGDTFLEHWEAARRRASSAQVEGANP